MLGGFLMEMFMKKNDWFLVRRHYWATFLLLVVFSLAAGPLAAQQASRPSCTTDASVMDWAMSAATGTTFTMTKDCEIDKDSLDRARYLWVRDGRTFTIDGAGFTIYAADKSAYDDFGTAFGFSFATTGVGLTLRNLTIDGGGDAASPTGSDPDPAIIVRNGTLVLDGVTIQNTAGGAIALESSGSITLKNVKFHNNSVATGNYGSAITVTAGGTITFQDKLAMTNNTGGKTAVYVYNGGGVGTIDMSALRCKTDSGNRNSDSENSAFFVPKTIGDVIGPIWTALPSCAGNAGSGSGGGSGGDSGGGGDGGSDNEMGMDMAMSKEDINYDRRIPGTVGADRSVYYRVDSGGGPVLQIYRVDENGEGHWVMDVPQATIDAFGGAGCVVASADGRYAVRVQAGGDITISDGPDSENKVFHNMLKGGVKGGIISTDTTYSTAPPGVGCPGYAG